MDVLKEKKVQEVLEQAHFSNIPILHAAVTKHRMGIPWETCMQEAALALDRHANQLYDRLIDCVNKSLATFIVEKEQSHGD